MFFLLAIVGVLHYVATANYLYWSTNEFDSLVHFLGGSTLSVFFLWLYFFSGFFNPQNRNLARFLIISILGSMFVAVSWEIFELFLGEAEINKVGYPFDTTMDLIMDLLGILAACLYSFIRELGIRKKVQTNNEQS